MERVLRFYGLNPVDYKLIYRTKDDMVVINIRSRKRLELRY